jgi:hypothetical protein
MNGIIILYLMFCGRPSKWQIRAYKTSKVRVYIYLYYLTFLTKLPIDTASKGFLESSR